MADPVVTPPAPPPGPPTPTAVPAPGASPPPTPAAPAPATPTPPETGAQDAQLKSIFDDLGVVLQASAPPTTPPAAPAPSAPPAAPTPGSPTPAASSGTEVGDPAVAPAPSPAPGTPQPVKVRSEKPIGQMVEDVVRKVMGEVLPSPAAAAPAAPQTPPAPAPAPEDPFVASASPAEKESLDLAKWADEHVPDQKGLYAKTLAFLKGAQSYAEKAAEKDPERKFDDSDEEFTQFIEETRPLPPDQWEKLKTQRLIHQVEESTTKKLEEKFSKENEQIRQRQIALETRPIIEKRLGLFQDNVGKLMLAEKDSPLAEIAATIGKDGVEKAMEADPIFTPIVVTAYNQGQAGVAEFLAMSHGVKPVDMNNPVHAWVIKFIRSAGEVFAAKGGDKTAIRGEDGTVKTFLPRGKFNEMARTDPSTFEKHWTFSDENILQMLERNTKDHIAALVKSETERLTKAGYLKQKPAAVAPNGNPPPAPSTNGTPPAPAPAAAPAAESPGSPRAGVTPAPGQGGGGVALQYALPDGDLQALGIPRKAA